MAPTRPSIQGDTLVYEHAGTARSLTVGGAAWYAWLADATRFAFADPHGSFTARKEPARGHGQRAYWYAYRKRGGTLGKVYLGRSEDLTVERLSAAATALAPAAADTETDAAVRAGPYRPVSPATSRATPLLATKLSVPRVRPTLLPRSNLLAQLHAGLAGPLTLLSAPAGFGKTTLLAAWRATPAGSAVPLAWVSLDAADSDPARFWSYVITALDALQPGLAATALPALRAVPPPPIEAILLGVLNALSTLPTHAVLVLDDYHAITSLPIHQALAFVVDHLPPCLHLVIATREDPPLPLARLRARGELTELRMGELRLTPDEVSQFLTEIMDLPLAAREVTALDARTEGWIAGLHLAALAMRDRRDLPSFVATFTGSNRFVLDYLASEVLDRLPAQLQTFVLHTSILDRLCGPLCDAVLPEPAASGQATLEALERANLFIVALDDERRWYRFHQLFVEVVRQRLTRATTKAPLALLHQRASTWYEQHGFVAEAVQHALAAEDVARAAQLIEHHSRAMWQHGDATVLQSWLHALPADLRRRRPGLSLAQAWSALMSGDLAAVEPAVRAAEAAADALDARAAGSLRAELAAIQSTLCNFRREMARSGELAQQALTGLPDDDSFVRGLVAYTLGRAAVMQGDLATARAQLTDAATRSRQAGNLATATLALVALGTAWEVRGQLREAATSYRQALQVAMPAGQPLPLLGVLGAFVRLGGILCEWNDLDAAADALEHGLELGRLLDYPAGLLIGYLHLARVRQLQGNLVGAVELVAQAAALTRPEAGPKHVPLQDFAVVVEAVRARLWLVQEQLGPASAWAEAREHAITFPPTGDWSDARQLARPRDAVCLTLARVFAAQHEFARALRLLARLQEAAEAGKRTWTLIDILNLRAVILQAQGDDTGRSEGRRTGAHARCAGGVRGQLPGGSGADGRAAGAARGSWVTGGVCGHAARRIPGFGVAPVNC